MYMCCAGHRIEETRVVDGFIYSIYGKIQPFLSGVIIIAISTFVMLVAIVNMYNFLYAIQIHIHVDVTVRLLELSRAQNPRRVAWH